MDIFQHRHTPSKPWSPHCLQCGPPDRWVGEIAKEGGAKKASQYLVSYICRLTSEEKGKAPQINRVTGDKGGAIQTLTKMSPKGEESFAAFFAVPDFLGLPHTLLSIPVMRRLKLCRPRPLRCEEVRVICKCVAIGRGRDAPPDIRPGQHAGLYIAISEFQAFGAVLLHKQRNPCQHQS